jgi:hypothetical protein
MTRSSNEFPDMRVQYHWTRIDELSATGAVTVSADDYGLITASSAMKAISSTTNDGGASLVGSLVDQLQESYRFSSASLGQDVSEDDLVRVASGHTGGGVSGGVYRYIGTAPLTLATATNYADTALWERVANEALSTLIPALNVTESKSVAVGGLIVRNELAGGATARIDPVKLSGGDVVVDALSRTELGARSEGIVTSSGGSAFGGGRSLAINAMIVTNAVRGSALSEIVDADIVATGTLTVTARNDVRANALLNSITQSGDTAVGVVLAFNSMGYVPSNLAYQTADAFAGTSLGTVDAAEAIARIVDSKLNVAGDLSVTADNVAQLNATLSNAASSEASALYGATGAAASVVLATNLVVSGADARITNPVISEPVGGAVTIQATDAGSCREVGRNLKEA